MTRSMPSPRWEEVFQGYDVRGRYPRPVGPATGRRLGEALARALHGPFLIGRDTRTESERLERALVRGLRAGRARVVRLGIVPTPEVAFHARSGRRLGLAVTPSHNALGFAGVKGFTTRGRLFDHEWKRVGEEFDHPTARRAGPTAGVPTAHRSRDTIRTADRVRVHEEYLDHVTDGLSSRLTIALDTRGGATARCGPNALTRIGIRVIPLTDGFSPTFFGGTPEPTPESLGALRDRVRSDSTDLGFAFDGDGDRCVVLDERGDLVEPEAIALLLHRTVSRKDRPIAASVDCSRILERHARTVRSRVGGRFMARAMRRAGAEVGVERSGHYYLRRYGADSDALLDACLVAHAVYAEKKPMSELVRAFGRILRGARTWDYAGARQARRAYLELLRQIGDRGTPALDGVTIDFAHGWCLVRRSNTQPSIRCSFEASDRAELDRIERIVTHWMETEPGPVGTRSADRPRARAGSAAVGAVQDR